MDQGFNKPVAQDDDVASKFHLRLKEGGINFATGVPCGVLKDIIKNFSADRSILHVPSLCEPEAIGIAAGAYLAGKKPAAYMQNSGLLKSMNDIGSLLLPYKIPILAIASFRGCEGESAPQHYFTGKATIPMLDAYKIPYLFLGKDSYKWVASGAIMPLEKGVSSVILVKRGWQGKEDSYNTLPDEIEDKEDFEIEKKRSKNKLFNNYCTGFDEMQREDSLDLIVEKITDKDAVFSATGLISRSLYERHDANNMFYVTGSFGLVSSIGLGFSLSRPGIRTYVIDGDGSLLTNLGTMASIGLNQPQNLVHIVLNNNSYASCSEEPTNSDHAHIPEIAKLQGYRAVYCVDDKEGLEEAFEQSKKQSGPQMIHVKIALGGRRDFKRPLDLPLITERFKAYFSR